MTEVYLTVKEHSFTKLEYESRAQEIRILKERRFLQTIIIISCAAFVSVVPSLIFSLFYNWLGLNILAFKIVGAITIFILCLNFAVNPFIYILRLPNYRKHFICFIAEKEQLLVKMFSQQNCKPKTEKPVKIYDIVHSQKRYRLAASCQRIAACLLNLSIRLQQVCENQT